MSARGSSQNSRRGRGQQADRDEEEVQAMIDQLNLDYNIEAANRLKNRLENLKLAMDDISKSAELVNKVIEIICTYLERNTPMNLRWEELRTGSYYDKTKVSRCTDECSCRIISYSKF
jgi:hypothetical protein